MDPTPTEYSRFKKLEELFNQAMIANDVSAIKACTTEDWVLVTPESGPVSRDTILALISSGALSHDSMTKEIARVAVYGPTAIVTSRGQNTGSFNGKRISADEWITDVYQQGVEGWLCVLTHLTPAIAPAIAPALTPAAQN